MKTFRTSMVVNAHNHRQQDEVEGSQRIIEKKKALTLMWEGSFLSLIHMLRGLPVYRVSIALVDSRALSPLGEPLFP